MIREFLSVMKSPWKRWLLPLSTSILWRNSVPSSNDSRFSPKLSAQPPPLALKHQVHILFFITVLILEKLFDLMTALLSPAVGGSMRSQMEAKLASLNLWSPGLKSNIPSSRSVHTLNQHQRHEPPIASIRLELLLSSPDSANSVGNLSDTAATLAQQRAKLKAASNAVHRISPLVLASSAAERCTWASVGSLGQVAERHNFSTQDISVGSTFSYPQSTDFSGLSGSLRFRNCRRRTTTPRATVRRLTSPPPN